MKCVAKPLLPEHSVVSLFLAYMAEQTFTELKTFDRKQILCVFNLYADGLKMSGIGMVQDNMVAPSTYGKSSVEILAGPTKFAFSTCVREIQDLFLQSRNMHV